MDFKERLQQILKERGWSIFKLTAESGLSENTIYNWFKFDSVPRIDSIERICETLEISLAEFFCDADYRYPNQMEKVVLELFGRLSEKKKRAAIEILKSLSE